MLSCTGVRTSSPEPGSREHPGRAAAPPRRGTFGAFHQRFPTLTVWPFSPTLKRTLGPRVLKCFLAGGVTHPRPAFPRAFRPVDTFPTVAICHAWRRAPTALRPRPGPSSRGASRRRRPRGRLRRGTGRRGRIERGAEASDRHGGRLAARDPEPRPKTGQRLTSLTRGEAGPSRAVRAPRRPMRRARRLLEQRGARARVHGRTKAHGRAGLSRSAVRSVAIAWPRGLHPGALPSEVSGHSHGTVPGSRHNERERSDKRRAIPSDRRAHHPRARLSPFLRPKFARAWSPR